MNKIDWKAKFASRKFWCSIAAWITSLLTAFNFTESTIAQVSIIVSGFGALVVYILAETVVDKARQAANTTVVQSILNSTAPDTTGESSKGSDG